MTILFLIGTALGCACVALCLCAAAKRGDEIMERAIGCIQMLENKAHKE